MADRDYDIGPATDILVNDFDDERTLDEEEALEGHEDSHNELSNLQKEGDMPLKDLLAMYGLRDSSVENSNSSDRMVLLPTGDAELKDKMDEDEEEDEEEEEEEEEEDDDDEPSNNEPDLKQFYTEMVKKEEMKEINAARVVSGGNNNRGTENSCVIGAGCGSESNITGGGNTRNDNNGVSGGSGSGGNEAGNGAEGNDGMETGGGNSGGGGGGSNGGSGGSGCGSSRLLRSVSRPQSEEEEDDCDYSPDEEEWKKTIMVGSDYQAAIPEGLCKYDDALPYENEDKMLWNPSHIAELETEEFLERAQLPAVKGSTLPAGSHIRDDEQALYLLLQCGYNLEEALRRRRMNVLPQTDSVSLWSEEECHNFESGLRNYGKDFHLIQKNKVRTRSVGELVQFYYLWKKTERHDIFTYKARLEKKKYALHPGITDYMDRFLEEQEGVRDRSSSPNVNSSLLYGDAKRQRTNANMTNNEDSKSLDLWDGAPAPGSTPGIGAANPSGVDPLAIDFNSSAPAPLQPPQHSATPVTTLQNSNATSATFNSTRGHMEYGLASKGNAEGGGTWSPSSSSPPSQRNAHQPNNNHLLTSSSNVSTGNETARSPENILPHLPP
ncbi:mesoderm induction early response protein 1 isoform X2 [Belonocnema kinseyi]|uniref:mesoderm induction early response protein 1 isoform X2 n=1 Tax=Belonocnema kinseyi TaxID=2817044 RepID=UPI00143D433E|nr:mesoderm induction early response protein 1 isoform X2 [Belonocnema kinseyi]